MRNFLPWVAVLVLVTACTVPKRPAPAGAGSSAPVGGAPATVEELAAAIKADSRRSDKETDGKARLQLAQEANGYAASCIAQAPQAAACLYGQGVAQGLDAQAHPTRALPLLKSMLQSLSSAEAADPSYDEGGPARVQALVLARAPGWPVGPGDADAAVEAARRAVSVRPDYPPNLLALGEALAKTGDPNEARDAYAKARDAAQALPPGEDRDGWVAEAERGLQKK
ncbi:MAG TPA: tetratricopeptide repeat protein [Steroidobacteraceae bacterium]|nr:tetratricopeptide repeat protein [Steroidobacteraceae bacterium]